MKKNEAKTTATTNRERTREKLTEATFANDEAQAKAAVAKNTDDYNKKAMAAKEAIEAAEKAATAAHEAATLARWAKEAAQHTDDEAAWEAADQAAEYSGAAAKEAADADRAAASAQAEWARAMFGQSKAPKKDDKITITLTEAEAEALRTVTDYAAVMAEDDELAATACDTAEAVLAKIEKK